MINIGFSVVVQILGTMLLLLCICAATDEKNTVVPPSLAPMYVGFAVLGVGVSFGANCGYALNPARDLSPRLLTFIAGWGNQVFRYNILFFFCNIPSHLHPFWSFSYKNFTWFWIPIVGPHIGAILGVFVYRICIEAHWPVEKERVSSGSLPGAKTYENKAIDLEIQ